MAYKYVVTPSLMPVCVCCQLICSYVLWPLAYFMGVEPYDCRKVAELIGTGAEGGHYKVLLVTIDVSTIRLLTI